MKIFFIIAFVAIIVFVTVVAEAKTVPETIDFHSATKCMKHHYEQTLASSPKRLAMFYEGMRAFLKDHSETKPHWFINTNKKKRSSSTSSDCTTTFAHDEKLHQQDPMNPAAECWEFLLAWMPVQDENLPIKHFQDTVEFALTARETFPVSRDIPWPIFLNEVLPYSVLTEPRDPWRPLFFRYYSTKYKKQLIDNTSLTQVDAFQFMNTFSWDIDSPPIHYAPCDADKICYYSPFQVLNNGNASCTGLAMFLIASLRSVGLPARLTGTPHWHFGPKKCPHGDANDACGNHDWVESMNFNSSTQVGAWSFYDPAGDKIMNHSWFYPLWTENQSPAKSYESPGNHSIFATSWASSEYLKVTYGDWYDYLAVPHIKFPMVWDWTSNISSAWDVTKRYLSMQKN